MRSVCALRVPVMLPHEPDPNPVAVPLLVIVAPLLIVSDKPDGMTMDSVSALVDGTFTTASLTVVCACIAAMSEANVIAYKEAHR